MVKLKLFGNVLADFENHLKKSIGRFHDVQKSSAISTSCAGFIWRPDITSYTCSVKFGWHCLPPRNTLVFFLFFGGGISSLRGRTAGRAGVDPFHAC